VDDLFVNGKSNYELDNENNEISTKDFPEIKILDQNEHYLIVSKPASVVCHFSDWSGPHQEKEGPVLQRLRHQIGRRVNLVNRLDRGSSGCLLLTYADKPDSVEVTSTLSEALADKQKSTKTYIALVRGEGILHGRDFKREGWFQINRPMKDSKGNEREASTWFRFLAGQHTESGKFPDRARASIVLARPETWTRHQIREHLNQISHPILGDSTYGSSTINREWREKRGMPPERTCLHLSRLQIAPTQFSPNGIDVSCPLAPDMMDLLQTHLPEVLKEAEPLLLEEGIQLT
jgi:tRNA pseudouridine65 synthase